MEPLALTVAQAAKLAELSRSAIYQDIRAGRLRAVKRGRSTRILMEDIRAYLASLPSLHQPRTPQAHAKQATVAEGSRTQGSFDFRESQDRGDRQFDPSSNGGV
jgi:excisionase family DNA binding protein